MENGYIKDWVDVSISTVSRLWSDSWHILAPVVMQKHTMHRLINAALSARLNRAVT